MDNKSNSSSFSNPKKTHANKQQLTHRAVRYDDIYRMDEIKSISFHIVLSFFFADFEQLHKHTYMHQNTRLCKYPHKHSDLCLKIE